MLGVMALQLSHPNTAKRRVSELLWMELRLESRALNEAVEATAQFFKTQRVVACCGDRLFGDHGRDLASVANAGSIGSRRCLSVMSEETTNQQSCGGKKRAMLAYGLVQISATVVSAVSLAAIAVGLCAVKQESRLFNGCVETVVAEGRSQAEAVRYCNGG